MERTAQVDVWRAANVLIKQHGEDAAIAAAQRADELLAPCTGILSSAWLFGEVFPPARYAGMALILAGLAVILLPGAKPPEQAEPFA